MTVIILGIVMAGLGIIAKWDKPLPLDAGMYLGILAAAFAEGAITRYLAGGLPGNTLMLSAIGGCLLLASVTDIVLCQVYDFTWWFALTAVLVSLQGISEESVWSLAFFFLLQFAVFGRLYGRADCYGFCVCAAAEAVMGMELSGFLVQMFLAWLLLFFVQAAHRNIDRKGNLKQPVPFLPYITAAFWLTIVLGMIEQMKPANF